jgi:wyosine [tRNA(Phe)-imidazoG37] synthetase (radical SAM superfamily)
MDLALLTLELEQALELIHSGGLANRLAYQRLPKELLTLRHVAFSGDGEPTLSSDFTGVVEAALRVRARGRFPFFKFVLITNASGLDRANVKEGLDLFSASDEVWAKLDAGSAAHFAAVNRPDCNLDKILANILDLARRRPVIIQSLFSEYCGRGPSAVEIDDYAERLRELKEQGAWIPLVQIYSATRVPANADCSHLRLRILSTIARRVSEVSGLKAEVF